MSTIFYIIFIIILKIIYVFDDDDEPPILLEDYPGIKCGKRNPKKPTDCTKYGTDSGMLCCWTSSGEYETSDAECTLLSIRYAELKGISGIKKYVISKGKRYWNCGNNVAYLNLNLIYLFYILLFLV